MSKRTLVALHRAIACWCRMPKCDGPDRSRLGVKLGDPTGPAPDMPVLPASITIGRRTVVAPEYLVKPTALKLICRATLPARKIRVRA